VAKRQDEFVRIAMPHTRSLLRVARRLSSNPATAEDLVQETMFLAWRGFHQFQPGTNIRAWLFRILLNAFNAEGRKLRSTPATVPLQSREFYADTHLQTAAEIAQVLDELGLEQRTALLLVVVEGFTCREAAGILSVPIGTVMSRLGRAREELRKRLAPKCSAKEAS
jgi:RNA polymerase sigma-70 factor (ECF subfamily)